MPTSPRVVLLCHEGADLDALGLAGWLSHRFQLVGLISIGRSPRRWWRAVRREWRRSGAIGALDVAAFRAWHRLTQAGQDARWSRDRIAQLQQAFPVDLEAIPRLRVVDPNAAVVQDFLAQHRADLLIARCKVLLKAAIFSAPSAGTFVFHPGICPEYRNAHGCFWALAQGDLARVGMTLLRIDRGVDTGPIYLQASYAFDERRESHIVIQHRVVLENLDRIGDALEAAFRGTAVPLSVDGRRSAVWGQPKLSAYLSWKRAARERANHAARLPSVS